MGLAVPAVAEVGPELVWDASARDGVMLAIRAEARAAVGFLVIPEADQRIDTRCSVRRHQERGQGRCRHQADRDVHAVSGFQLPA